VDLPTYTNIWRIEKRLYKLYDFRLPMPLPVGQIAVFLAIAVPYVGLLAAIGLPFSHTLLWLYVLPPGVLAWLTTRPVLEGKKLPELVLSQIRYLLEPRTWCRLAPLTEKDEIALTCRVWHRAEPLALPVTAPSRAAAQSAAQHASRPARMPAIRIPARTAAATPVAAVPAAAVPAAAVPAAAVPAAAVPAGAAPAAGLRAGTAPAIPAPRTARPAAQPLALAPRSGSRPDQGRRGFSERLGCSGISLRSIRATPAVL